VLGPFSLLLPYNPYPALYKKQAQEGIFLCRTDICTKNRARKGGGMLRGHGPTAREGLGTFYRATSDARPV
jgi:hypothetical protein